MIAARRSRGGYSLLEVMVAVAILVVMAVITFSVLDSSIQVRDALAESDDTHRAARVAVDKLRRELQLAYLTPNVQAVNTYETVFVGSDDNPDRLWFASLSHQRLYRDSRECDQTEISVWGEPDRDLRSAHVLFHREAPRIDEEPDEGGPIFPLAHGVRTFNLRYLDSRTNEWTDSWDTRGVDQAQRLPRAVQIGLVLIDEVEDEDGRTRTVEYPVVTTVMLQYAEELKRSAFNPLAGGQ